MFARDPHTEIASMIAMLGLGTTEPAIAVARRPFDRSNGSY